MTPPDICGILTLIAVAAKTGDPRCVWLVEPDYLSSRHSQKQAGRDLFLKMEVKSVSEIKRRKTESFEAFMRRVKKRWQQSGKILQVKKIRFFKGPNSKTTRKKSALHRLAVAEKMTYLKKIGRLPEEKTQKFGRR